MSPRASDVDLTVPDSLTTTFLDHVLRHVLDFACCPVWLGAFLSLEWWASPSGLRRQVVALEIEGSNPSVHPTPSLLHSALPLPT